MTAKVKAGEVLRVSTVGVAEHLCGHDAVEVDRNRHRNLATNEIACTWIRDGVSGGRRNQRDGVQADKTGMIISSVPWRVMLVQRMRWHAGGLDRVDHLLGALGATSPHAPQKRWHASRLDRVASSLQDRHWHLVGGACTSEARVT